MIKTIEKNLNIMFAMLLACAIFILPIEAAASGSDGISGALCNVIGQLNGPWGKGIATIAVVALGIGLFLGKLSWGLAISTAIGIGMIFGASALVSTIGGAGVSGGSC